MTAVPVRKVRTQPHYPRIVKSLSGVRIIQLSPNAFTVEKVVGCASSLELAERIADEVAQHQPRPRGA